MNMWWRMALGKGVQRRRVVGRDIVGVSSVSSTHPGCTRFGMGNGYEWYVVFLLALINVYLHIF